MTPPATLLFRPIGQAEMELIEASSWKAFPPRLFHQPIFYPVLTEDYAIRIARDWNTGDAASGFVGYVTRFHVRTDYLAAYTIHEVGGRALREYWIPAEELESFNANLVGLIKITHTFRPSDTSAK
jgi:hypothetical protein